MVCEGKNTDHTPVPMFAPILCESEIHSVRAGYYKFCIDLYSK